jgi:apolipoprotein N-acyltransferase
VWALLCLLAGGLQAVSLAWPWAGWVPPGWSAGQPSGVLQILALTVLVLSLQHSRGMAQAGWRGGLFATAWLAGTFWWLFVSLHTYGGLPAVLAVLAVLALAGALALLYAGAAALWWRGASASPGQQVLLFAALWTLAELARGRWFTGFPWGAGGYAQVDLMAAWAPWVGVYGMGFGAALLAGGVAWALTATVQRLRRTAQRVPAEPASAPAARHGLARWGLPLLLLTVVWSLWGGAGYVQAWATRDTASAGELRVWLLQGNVAQDEKFEIGTGVAQALNWYPQQLREAVAAARRGNALAPQLVVSPETALPMLPQQLGPDFWQMLLNDLAQPGVADPVHALLGLPLGSYAVGYTNSVWGISPVEASSALTQWVGRTSSASSSADPVPLNPDFDGFYRYDKHHLVPFGEFVPPLFRWFVNLMHIPLGDFNRGALGQASWPVAGQRVAPNICYEDLFGEELAAAFRDPAQAPTVLVNLSNIGWFGDTVAIDQHLHISRLRALELGRPMLRATNTGATAVIDHQGRVTHQLPRLSRDRLEATVQGRSGSTPYARWSTRWGLWPLWLGCLVLALLCARRGRASAAGPGVAAP